MRKTTKIILIIAGILTIVGLAISVSGMAMTGFQWDQLSILSLIKIKNPLMILQK